MNWPEFRDRSGIGRGTPNQGLVRILGLDPVGSGRPRTYGQREWRRWAAWTRMGGDHRAGVFTDAGKVVHRVLRLVGDHDTGWVVASGGKVWWQPEEPDVLTLLGAGVFAIAAGSRP